MTAPPPPAPAHRRHHSELDMNSLRRISEALLLAQNRARRATDRANRSERLLHAVFARVDDATAAALRVEMDALSGLDDWRAPAVSMDDMALREAPSLTTQLLARPSAIEDAAELEIAQVAREIVANLRGAGARHRLLVDHVAKRVSADDSAIDDYRRRAPRASMGVLGFSSLQFVAGLLVGVCMGVTLARLASPSTVRQQSLVSKLSKWCSDRARVGRYYASPHALPFPLDDLSYFVHPPAVEVA